MLQFVHPDDESSLRARPKLRGAGKVLYVSDGQA